MFYILGFVLAYFYFSGRSSQQTTTAQDAILVNICLALAWPIFALGLVWINRVYLRESFLIFFDLDTYEILDSTTENLN